MSMFAKIFIIVNFALSIVLGGLLGALLVQKFDYKARARETASRVELVKDKLEKDRSDFQAQEQALQRAQLRYEKKSTESKERLETLTALLKDINDNLSAVRREVSTLDGERQSLDESIAALTKRQQTLRDEIKTIEEERESALRKAKEYDDEEDKLTKEDLALRQKLRNSEKAMNKLADSVEELEGVWRYIVQNYPGVEIKVKLPPFQGGQVVQIEGPNSVRINKGRDQGMKHGGRVIVSRNNNFVGGLIIQGVSKETAVGRPTLRGPAWPPKAGDTVVPDNN